MRSKVFIIIIFTFCIQANLRSQIITDTLQWLKTNIEQKSYLFTGKPLKIVFDSLGNLKNALVDYDPPLMENGQFPDTTYNTVLKIYFTPGSLKVNGAHWSSFVASSLNKDTLNTHVPYLKIFFANPVPFVTDWFTTDKERLGSIRWNRYLRNYWGQFIVQSMVVGEY